MRVEIMFGLKLAGRIADGSVDVGVCLHHERLKPLPVEMLMEERADLYCGPSHPMFALSDEELTRERIEAATYCHRGEFESFHPEGPSPLPIAATSATAPMPSSRSCCQAETSATSPIISPKASA